MKCPDCKGTGKYVGARIVEDCRLCGGSGKLLDKAKALESMFDANAEAITIELSDHDDERIRQIKSAIKNHKGSIKALEGFGRVTPELKIGDAIYVYDTEWYETTVTHMKQNSPNGPIGIRTEYACGSFRMLYHHLSYNTTQKRWEYIKSGTPLWP